MVRDLPRGDARWLFIEVMVTDCDRFWENTRPLRVDRFCMIVRRAFCKVARFVGQKVACDFSNAIIGPLVANRFGVSIAGIGKLTAELLARALIYHLAYRRRVACIVHSIQDHLANRINAFDGFATCLEIECFRQTLPFPVAGWFGQFVNCSARVCGGRIIDVRLADQTIQAVLVESCLLYTSPSPRDLSTSRMPSSA